MEITIKLSEKDIKKLIITYLHKEGYKVTADDINFLISSRLEEYCMQEYTVNYFDGASINCKRVTISK